jgi:outer membrane protein assembly factor BamB
MKQFVMIAVLGCAAGAMGENAGAMGENRWTGFRGERFGHSDERGAPVRWSAETGVAWKVKLAGYGQSTPLVWGKRVYVTATEGVKKERQWVEAREVETGVELWRREFESSAGQESHERSSKAAPTGVVDAERVYALFDCGDLYALTHEGKLEWARRLGEEYGRLEGPHGYASSLAQTAEAVYVLGAQAGAGWLVAIDKKTGKTAWKVDLEAGATFSSPVVHDGVLYVTRGGTVTAWEAATGRERWSVAPPKASARGFGVPSLTVAGDWMIVPCGEKGCTYAVNVKSGKVAWQAVEAANDFSSPVVVDGRAYLVNSVGVLFVVDVATGKELARTRLPAPCWASAVVLDGRLYFFTTDGRTVVIKPGAGVEKLAENALEVEGRVYAATPVAGGLLLRTGRELWRVGKAKGGGNGGDGQPSGR